jgi:isopentenyl diphosphate isomerase/L-lactate dehydrogenase-like FMN-dependent dehydrogenase
MISAFTWDDVSWIRNRWEAPLVIKGVLSGHDAQAAVDCGADAVIVSNHGGRQLDGAPATLTVLSEVVDAIGTDHQVLLDGGIRRGSDVVKALALGARAVFIGRPYLYGLAADGQRGVERVLDILDTEIRRSLLLMGCPRVQDLDPSWTGPPNPTTIREPIDGWRRR